ncbi:putative spermidine/putrescine transport system ATP-binding protein [Bosea sp. OK403]|uniref:ABC transporter ATP-binding protein n=1 Tax=Bosea sp. OK403 TaxID=1855286 RepID=UPI0008E4F7E2|nr:ABC transporter ATP-binding protein [Bosea sp. OK403]SFJ73364.1 putative spermidine/putrescine transport system ATP-binding protein [Bosea sp. OK403]
MTNRAAVRFSDVSKQYGSTTVLSDFNLDVKAGEFVTLLGPSGSGKTTALNALAGFVEISSGDIAIDDKSVAKLAPEERGIGMVFQGYSLFPHMNVFDNVAFPLKLRKYSRSEIARRVEDALGMVRLSDFAGRMPKELSGGQRQRVAFARAVVFEPPVLLMDEPLSALDLKLREAMRLEIKRYHSQLGCTILFVTHDQGEALAMSDRIAVMGNGKIVQIDTPRNIYDRPNNRYVAEFIGQTNFIDAALLRHGVRGAGLLQPSDETAGKELPQLLSVRPERLRLGVTAEQADVVFDCEIDQVLFLGESTELSLTAATGQPLVARTAGAINDQHTERGSKLKVGFDMSDAVVLSN